MGSRPMCVCIYIYIYICTYTQTHTYIHACMHACMRACVRACVHIYIYICVCVPMVCVYVCARVIYTYIYTLFRSGFGVSGWGCHSHFGECWFFSLFFSRFCLLSSRPYTDNSCESFFATIAAEGLRSFGGVGA